MAGKHVEWVDLVKVITMLLVIIGHCNYYEISTSYGSVTYLEINGGSKMFESIQFLTRFIYSFHMPLFMAVSGAVYALTRKQGERFSDFASKKAKRLLIPFLLVTTFVSVPCKYISGYYDSSSNILRDIFMGQYLLLGDSHLWFVVCLFLIFMVAYWLERLQVRKNLFFVAVLLLFSWIGYRISYTDSLKHISLLLTYLFYFYVGFMMIGYFSAKEKSNRYIVLSWLLLLLVYGVYYQYDFSATRMLRIANYPLRTLFPLWGIYNMMFTCKKMCSQINSLPSSKIYSYLKANSYDLYLYSDPLNYPLIPILVYFLGDSIFTTDSGAFTAFMVRFFGTLFGAMLLIYIIKQIKIRIGSKTA